MTPCPNDPTHKVEWDVDHPSRLYCPPCNLIFDPTPPVEERTPYRDDD